MNRAQLGALEDEIARRGRSVAKAAWKIELARDRLHELIRRAVRHGARPVDIANLAGYTRQRVYQICDNNKEGEE